MDLKTLHFAHPLWFWALCAIPLVWGIFLFYYQRQQPLHQLEKFIDKHLIPYLLLGGETKKKRLWPQLLFWSFVWSCLVVALAGPRWDFREIATFTRDQSLVILLDLSESMNAKDIPPSRLGRAKQKIEDLLNMSKGVKIGLIAFAADPHMIVPMTEDKETIRHLLPSLDTDLVYVQGSKLAPALEMAATMLENEPGTNKAIAIISDGGFEDASAIYTAKRLAGKGIVLYAIGVGSLEGAPLKDQQGAVIKKNGSPIVSKLEKEKFREISIVGHGRYFDADHSEPVALIFEDLEKRSNIQQETHKTQRLWEEHFYLFLLPAIPFFLWWYRRGYVFAWSLFVLIPNDTYASLSSYFYNTEQQANQAYEIGDYATAGHDFQDPYRKGVAYYRMGDYAAAEEMFRHSLRPEVASSAAYNLGNALVQQNKLQDAVAAYEEVLKKWPNHIQAKENLELVKKMLNEQEQQQEQQQQEQQQEQQQKKEQQQQSDPTQEKSDQQNNKQNPQEQNKDTSEKQNEEEPSQEQSQKESTPEEKETNSAKEQSATEEPSQSRPEEKESFRDVESQQEKEPPQEAEGLEPREQELSAQQKEAKPAPRSQEDLDADLWLNQIKNDPKSFLKNKFYLESKKNGTKEGIDPW